MSDGSHCIHTQTALQGEDQGLLPGLTKNRQSVCASLSILSWEVGESMGFYIEINEDGTQKWLRGWEGLGQ